MVTSCSVFLQYSTLRAKRNPIIPTDALSLLYDRMALRVQELADILGIPKQHASKIMTKLESMALVSRDTDPSDKRAAIFRLTAEGSALMHAHLTASNRNFERLISSLSEADQARMADAMATMIELLEKM